MLCPRELKAMYREGCVLPFIGAGASMAIRWKDSNGNEVTGPSWESLVDEATHQLAFQSPELARVRGTDLQILEYFKLKNSGQTAKLTNWLTRKMVPPDDAITCSGIHSELSKLTNCNTIYTTNYDDFIERSFLLKGRACKVIATEQDMGRSGTACEIIKFHGDLDHPDQIVLTESEYLTRMKLGDPLDYRLRSDLLGRVLLFIGYSFRDPNVSYLFRLFTDGLVGIQGAMTGDRAYIVVPDASDFEYKLFQQRGIRVISIKGSRKEDEIATLLKEMRG